MKIQNMDDGVRLFLLVFMILAWGGRGVVFGTSTSSVLSPQERGASLSRSSGSPEIAGGDTSLGHGPVLYYTPGILEIYEAPRFTWLHKVLVAETGDRVPEDSLLPETYLPEQVPAEQNFVVPLPGPRSLPLAETGDAEVQAPPTVPRNVEPALPPAPEPSIAGIALPGMVLPPSPPPSESLELPPVLEPSIADLIPVAGLVPSVSVPPSPPPVESTEPKVSTLPEPTPPPEVSLSGSIITVRPFTPSQEMTAAPVHPLPPAAVEPVPVQTPEPPRLIRPAEPEPVPQIVRQALPQREDPIQELPGQNTSPGSQQERQAKAAYSRTVRAVTGQMVAIPFRGTGWVYLGEQESQPGIAYNSRYLEKEGQTFVFQTESPGIYTLTFYKQDFIEDYIIDDAVQVIVNPVQVSERGRTSMPVDPDRVIAEPRWPTLPREAGEDRKAPPSIEQPLRELPLTAVTPPEIPPGPQPTIDYLQQAREAYAAGQFPQALSSLDQFREQYPAGTDEAWWIYGQSLEAASPNRDIRSALDYYHRLIREYPQSLRGNDARRRIAYLERYYFTIQ
ncbi:hypothetical protein Holit_02455 [Hollandina sp. SP2]